VLENSVCLDLTSCAISTTVTGQKLTQSDGVRKQSLLMMRVVLCFVGLHG